MPPFPPSFLFEPAPFVGSPLSSAFDAPFPEKGKIKFKYGVKTFGKWLPTLQAIIAIKWYCSVDNLKS